MNGLPLLAITTWIQVAAPPQVTSPSLTAAPAHEPEFQVALPRAIEVRSVELEARPAWVPSGFPDTVWVLMEAAVASDDDERLRARLLEAEARARDELEGNEADPNRRFALAAVLGMRADREGGRTKIRAASELHDELEALLAIDPDHARGRYMMGRLHAGVRRMNRVTRWLATNLLGGGALKKASWEAAEEHLAFAAQHAPEVPDHHLQLARLYEDTDRPEMALNEVAQVLQIEPASPMEMEVYLEALELHAELMER